MEYPASPAATRLHPLITGAAASVVLVSLLGAAAISGILPSSHSTPVPTNLQTTSAATMPAASQTVTPVSASRFITADGRVLEEVPNVVQATPVRAKTTATISSGDRAVRENHKAVRHAARRQQQVALNDSAGQYEPPVYQSPQAQQQPVNQAPSQPASVFGNVNPVQTGVGAVIGGLLGSQVGKGNGRTLATVAGVIAGGYAGNEISHGRSPIPTW